MAEVHRKLDEMNVVNSHERAKVQYSIVFTLHFKIKSIVREKLRV